MSIRKISPRQIKAARALLGWTRDEAAERAELPSPAIKRLETADGACAAPEEAAQKLVAALKAAGVIFLLDENGEGPGLRLKKQLAEAAEINEKIEALNAAAASLDVDGEPSPAVGMARMKKAFVENEKVKLQNKKARIRKKT